ncbi:unnamed protein product [Symbiodinium sp. CCMP2592]|nr:unnamed protein product [Symbiodinium sp. CCMP2592]
MCPRLQWCLFPFEKDLRLPWSGPSERRQCNKARLLFCRRPHFVYLPPFLSFWLAVLTCASSILRRRSCSSSCIGSSLFLWIPLGMFSALLFLRLSVCEWLPPAVMLMPILLVTGALIIFSGFLSMASFWLGWRGSRDWMEYASTTLVVILTVLLPLLAIQLALIGCAFAEFPAQMSAVARGLWTQPSRCRFCFRPRALHAMKHPAQKGHLR